MLDKLGFDDSDYSVVVKRILQASDRALRRWSGPG